jgi:hypothetical protein
MGGAMQGGAYSGQGGAQGGETVARATLAQTLLRVVLALTAVDPGGARVRLARSSHSSSASHSSAFGGSQGSAFGGSTSQGQGDAYANEEDGEDAEDDEDEDDEDEDQLSGAPLYFWYLLQEALWEVPVSGFYFIFYLEGRLLFFHLSLFFLSSDY